MNLYANFNAFIVIVAVIILKRTTGRYIFSRRRLIFVLIFDIYDKHHFPQFRIFMLNIHTAIQYSEE